MPHILYAYILYALDGALERDATREEYDKAIKAIEKYDRHAFELPNINKSPKEKKKRWPWARK